MMGVNAPESRVEKRSPCKIRAKARCLGLESTAVVLDLSEDGFSLYLRSDIGAIVGRQVTIDTEELGQLTGNVSWARLQRVGVTIGRSSNTAAKIASYFNALR